MEGILELERAAAVLGWEVALVDGIGHAGEEEAVLERGRERAVRAAKAGLEARRERGTRELQGDPHRLGRRADGGAKLAARHVGRVTAQRRNVLPAQVGDAELGERALHLDECVERAQRQRLERRGVGRVRGAVRLPAHVKFVLEHAVHDRARAAQAAVRRLDDHLRLARPRLGGEVVEEEGPRRVHLAVQRTRDVGELRIACVAIVNCAATRVVYPLDDGGSRAKDERRREGEQGEDHLLRVVVVEARDVAEAGAEEGSELLVQHISRARAVLVVVGVPTAMCES